MNQNDIISTVEATAPATFKVVINTCFGGFGLSDEATAMLCERKGIASADLDIYDIFREDADLVYVVETLGVTKAGDGRYARLKVVEVPMWAREKGWHIEEYDGMECIAENHQTWN